jgi:hypothetical protein
MSSLLLEFRDRDGFSLASTNGYALAVVDSKAPVKAVAPENLAQARALLSANCVKALVACVGDTKESIQVTFGELPEKEVQVPGKNGKPPQYRKTGTLIAGCVSAREIGFEGSNWTLVCRSGTGNFPNYRKVIPSRDRRGDISIPLPTKPFRKALKIAQQAGDDYNRQINFLLHDGWAQLMLKHPGKGTSSAGFLYMEGGDRTGVAFRLRADLIDPPVAAAISEEVVLRAHRERGKDAEGVHCPFEQMVLECGPTEGWEAYLCAMPERIVDSPESSKVEPGIWALHCKGVATKQAGGIAH